MACKTIIVDEDNILANPEVEPFFYGVRGSGDLVILQSFASGYGRLPIGARLQDTLVTHGWRGKWQLVVLVPIRDLKRNQIPSIPTHTERVILENVVQRMVTGLAGRDEPVRTIVILYDSRHWEMGLGRPFQSAETQRYELDRFGYLAEEEDSEVPSFTRSELAWLCEPWPDMAWFVSYFASIAKAPSSDLEVRKKSLRVAAGRMTERLIELTDEKVKTLEGLTQGDVNHLISSLAKLKLDFSEQLQREIEGKTGLKANTPLEILTRLLRDLFSVKPYCEANRLLLLRFIKDSHGKYENGLVELSYLLLVLVEYELLKFGSAHENLGWRVKVELDPDQFGQAMANYGARLTTCLQEVEEQAVELARDCSFVKKIRCPEIRSRSITLNTDKLKKISLKRGEWSRVLPGKARGFVNYIQENERVFEEERREIVAQPEIEESLSFRRQSLEARAQELQRLAVEQHEQLQANPLTGFHTVYTWAEKSKLFDKKVRRVIEISPSVMGLTLLLVFSVIMFPLPFIALSYGDGGLKEVWQSGSLSMVLLTLVLLLLSTCWVWLRRGKRLRKIRNGINGLIVENKTRLKSVSRGNREYLSGVCTLSEISQNQEIVQKGLCSIDEDVRHVNFLTSELRQHHDLKICVKHSGRTGVAGGDRFRITGDFQPDVIRCHVFYPGLTECSFAIKKGDAAAVRYKSVHVPGLTKISFRHDFLFETP